MEAPLTAPVRPEEHSGKKCIVIRSKTLEIPGISALGTAHRGPRGFHFIKCEKSQLTLNHCPGIV